MQHQQQLQHWQVQQQQPEMSYSQQYAQHQPQLVHPQSPFLGMPGYQQYPLPLGAAGGFPGQLSVQAQQQWQAPAGGGGIHQPR